MMKKAFLSCTAVALFTFVLTSCGENKETKTETTTTTEMEKPADAVAIDAPAFSNEEVNKGPADYKALINDYVTAYKNKDQAKIADLNTKAQIFATNAATWGQKLKPEEAQKFGECITKLSQEFVVAAAQ